MKERQLAEARVKPPIAYRRFRVDIAAFGEPVDRLLLAADFIGELELDRLPASEHPAIGYAVERRALDFAAILHHAFEPRIGIEHQRLNGGARLRTGGFEAVGGGL